MFTDRVDAGRRLAALLRPLPAEERDCVVLGLPRGGVVVAAEVARDLGAPLDVVVVRKLGAPGRPELAMGAIGEDGCRVLDPLVVARVGAGPDDVARCESRERALLGARTRRIRAVLPRHDLTDRAAIVVDDGLATGATARAACRVTRALGAARVVLAVPVAPVAAAVPEADRVVVLDRPADFRAVSVHYRRFGDVSDDEVLALLTAP